MKLKIQKDDSLLEVKWDLPILNVIIGYIYRKSNRVSITNLRNIYKLVRLSDLSKYRNKDNIIKRIDFIQKTLEAKLEKKLENEDLVLDYCKPDFEDRTVEEIINNLPNYKNISFADMDYITNWIEDRLRYGVIENYKGKMVEILENIDSGEYNTYAEAHLAFVDWITGFQKESRKIVASNNMNMINLNDPNLVDRIEDMKQRLGNTSNIIITGMQMLNEMLSPGFRPGRLYTILGVSGGFKSAMLVKIILDCIKFNSTSYIAKTENMKPVVLYVTMENTLEESFARMYNMEIRADDMENYESAFIVDELTKAGIANNENMEMVMVYRANRTINTNDLRALIDQLAEEGKEVCMLSFDYIKRIKPVEKALTEKEELKNVTNELKQIGIDYQIPVVTAHQMNRDGAAKIEAGTKDNKENLGKFLGASNVGTAWEVMENSDFTLILNLERVKSGQMFLTMQRAKTRYRPHTALDYFNQPFEMENSFKLINDITDPQPMGVINLASEMEGVDIDDMYSRRGKRRIKNLIHDDEESTPKVGLFDLKPTNTRM